LLKTVFKGKVWKFGRDINTDIIIAGKRKYDTLDIKEISKYAFEAINHDFSKKVKDGDVIVAGANFGCGSSREHAPLVIKALGISAIIAESFARIFYRNAINIGLSIVECKEASEKIEEGDEVEINLEKGTIKNLTKNEEYHFKPLPLMMTQILNAGGLVPFLSENNGYQIKQ
jgi:3-isopropylmalate/(R)-2-methylmalate dehydratase small subunit